MFTLIATARLGAPAEVKELGGKPALKFTAAAETGYGEKKRTVWLNCTYWRDNPQALAALLTRGRRVNLIGTPEARAYTDRNGQQAASFDLVVRELDVLDAPGDAAAQPATNVYGKQVQAGAYDPSLNQPDDLPF